MDIQTRKNDFIREFQKLQNEVLISKFENLLYSEIILKNDQQLKPLSIEELNIRIDKSLDDSKNNRLTKSNTLLAEIETWD